MHFDWDILGVNLETFSSEMTPLLPCLGETPVTPEQVELFTSLLRQEATTVETSSFKPMFPKSIIMQEKSQNVRQMPINVQTQPAQEPAKTPYITVKASVSALLQPMAPLVNLESLEVLDHLKPLEITQKPVMAAANPPAMEDTKHSVEMPSTQRHMAQVSYTQRHTEQKTSTQLPMAQTPVAQMPKAQKPLTAQTTYAQEPANIPYITVKASVSASLQPIISLEVLDILAPLETAQEPVMAAAYAPATENTKSSMEMPSTQVPTAQKSIIAQTVPAQEPVIVVANTHAMENVTPSVKASYTQMSTAQTPAITQTPFTQLPTSQMTSMQMPSVQKASTQVPTVQKSIIAQTAPAQEPATQIAVTQMPIIAQTQSAQVPLNTPYITVKASISAPLMSMASLGALEVLENPEPIEFAQMPVMTAANTPAMENAKPSVEMYSKQMPIMEDTKHSVPMPSTQMFVAQKSSGQVPTPQKPIIAQTTFTQMPIMAVANTPTTENAKPSVEVYSTQVPKTLE